MDYEEFNKEYKKFEMWNDKADFINGIDELSFGDKWKVEFDRPKRNLGFGAKKNDIPQLPLTQLEGPHSVNDMWLDIDKWTGQEDKTPVELFRGSAKNNIQSTGWIPDDRVNSPSHYTSGRMEAIDIIEDAISTAPTPGKGLLQAQVLKYILRLWLKDSPVEDAKKAEWYLRRLIDSLE